MEDDSFQANTADFLAWLHKIGVNRSPKIQIVDLRAEGRGRGVVAVADFEEDEVVFTIPRTAVLNIHTALSSIQNPSARQAVEAMPNWLALTTLMMLEALKTDSTWAPYLAVLPHQLDSLVFWSDEELAELQASTVAQKVGKGKAEDMFEQHIFPFGLENYSPNISHRVASIIMAYAFDIPEDNPTNGATHNPSAEEGDDLVSDDGEDEKTVLSMIPLADMLNADADRNNARLCCDNADLEMRTIKPIAKGEEVLNDYGQLPRSDMLRRYGYVTEQYAQYDVAEISTTSILAVFSTIGTLPNLIEGSLRHLNKEELKDCVELAEREGIYEESYDVRFANEDEAGIPDELLALVYILLLNQESLGAIVNSETSLPSRTKLTTELVGRVITILLRTREREYATSIEEDEELLRKGNSPRRMIMAIQVRLGEKKVLRAAIQEASQYSGSNKRMRGQNSDNSVAGTKRRGLDESSKSSKKGRFR